MGGNALEAYKGRIEEALIGFLIDPADSDYQRGYEAALKEVKKELEKYGEEELNKTY